ncbi:MAG: hypothetical protein ACI9QC_000247 [Oceanicoccus sp.]|jgi:hypothetical protein
MKNYTHYAKAELLLKGYSKRDIGMNSGVSHSDIVHKVQKNSTNGTYD